MTIGKRFLVAAVPRIAADPEGGGHMGDWGWGMAVFGWLFMVALIVLVAWLIVSSLRRPAGSPGSGSRAIDLLDARYARGEIGRDEYLERRSDLEG